MRSVAVTVIALAFVVLPASANVSLPAEFREIVRDSNVIVRGRITDVRSVVVPERGIESIATVAVESLLKGQASGFVYVRVPGGEVGRSRVVMTGVPTLKVGQRAVYFLRPTLADSSYRPVGMAQGIYQVQPDTRTGRPVVAPPLVSGVTEARSGRAVRGDSRRRLMPVQEFESLVRVVVASSGKAGIRGVGR